MVITFLLKVKSTHLYCIMMCVRFPIENKMGEQGFDIALFQGLEQAFEVEKTNAMSLRHTHIQEMESFEPSDLLFLNDDFGDSSNDHQQIVVKPSASILVEGRAAASTSSPSSTQLPEEIPNPENKKSKSERAVRHAFRTRSALDILEDGYKWRKYGKKFLKNCPNPRNYYRCSYGNCNVKKRVQRDAHDKGIVITTYEGKHNHQSSAVLYYIGKPPVIVPHPDAILQSYPHHLST